MKMSSDNKKTILHIITGTSVGGAESMLYKLVRLDHSSHNVVISLTDWGLFADKISQMGVSVHALKISKNPVSVLKGVFNLLYYCYCYRPNIAVFWMYHSCFSSFLLRLFYWRKLKIIWNIRHTLDNIKNEKKLTRFLIRTLAKFSWFPEKILYNSSVSASKHEKFGFLKSKQEIIFNGFDIDQFKPDLVRRKHFRKTYNFTDADFLIGHAARYHPMKDHLTLIKSFKRVLEKYPKAHLLICGRGVNQNNMSLVKQIHSLGIAKNVYLLGQLIDLRDFYSALDLFVLSSAWGEGFSNVLGEAMACGVPCVATNVGDAARIVGSEECIVNPKMPEALAESILKQINKINGIEKSPSDRVRQHIINSFSLPKIVLQYNKLYQ